ATLEQLAGVDRDRLVAAGAQRVGEVVRARRDDDVGAVGDRGEAEHLRIGVGRDDRVGQQVLQGGAAARGEGRRVVGDAVVVDDGQRGVQVVVAGVDQAQ